GVPFSADATTILHAILGDGTRLDQTTTDRYYRDSTGRVRIERHMEGLAAENVGGAPLSNLNCTRPQPLAGRLHRRCGSRHCSVEPTFAHFQHRRRWSLVRRPRWRRAIPELFPRWRSVVG